MPTLWERLNGTNSNKWNPWIYSIREKLIADTLLYDIKRKRIVYMLSQTSNVLFAEITAWFESKKDAVTLDKFFKKAKHLMGVHHLKADIK